MVKTREEIYEKMCGVRLRWTEYWGEEQVCRNEGN